MKKKQYKISLFFNIIYYTLYIFSLCDNPIIIKLQLKIKDLPNYY